MINPVRISLALYAQALIFGGASCLVLGFLLGRSATLQVGPRPQIDIEIIEMTNDVLIGSKAGITLCFAAVATVRPFTAS